MRRDDQREEREETRVNARETVDVSATEGNGDELAALKARLYAATGQPIPTDVTRPWVERRIAADTRSVRRFNGRRTA